MSTHYCARCLTTFTDDAPSCPNLGCGRSRPNDGWADVLSEGDLLDRHYRIDRPLAVAGAGITYLAREVDGDGEPGGPELAVKVLYAARDSGPFLRRLANEAQILQELAHPHIVECRGFVHRTGHPPYLVTLFERGGSLQDHVGQTGPLRGPVATGILKQILLALDVAHERGVVHRDLKPDNVLLAERVPARQVPWCRVADFGIAKVFGGVGDRLTKLGSFIGTPEYAAPEQFEGMTPTPGTDVFAAGGLLYFLLTGEPPITFTQRHDIETSYEELLKSLPPRLPPEVADREVLQPLIDGTMAVKQGDRMTVQQILKALEPLVGAPPIRTDAAEDTFTMETPEPGDLRRKPTVPHTPEPVPAVQRARTEPMPKPPPPPPVVQAPVTPPKPSRGGLIGVLGVAATAAIGGTITVGVLLGAAWAFGWFGGSAPAEVDPVEITLDTEAVWAEGPAEAALTKAIEATASDLKRLCRPSLALPIQVVVEPGGAVRSARVSPMVRGKEPATGCVEDALERLVFDNPETRALKVKARLEF